MQFPCANLGCDCGQRVSDTAWVSLTDYINFLVLCCREGVRDVAHRRRVAPRLTVRTFLRLVNLDEQREFARASAGARSLKGY